MMTLEDLEVIQDLIYHLETGLDRAKTRARILNTCVDGWSVLDINARDAAIHLQQLKAVARHIEDVT